MTKAEQALIDYGRWHGWSVPYITTIAPELVKLVLEAQS